jgi:hypothetical protein
MGCFELQRRFQFERFVPARLRGLQLKSECML